VSSNPAAGMFVCVYSEFVLSCVWVEAFPWADPPSKESYRPCIGLGKLRREVKDQKYRYACVDCVGRESKTHGREEK
jgi:hypothetical protein